MSYISEIFQRSNIENVRDFLLYGSDGADHCSKSYIERLNLAYENIHKVVCESSKVMDNEEIVNKIMDEVCLVEKVHMEIGLQCGFKLALQFVGENINLKE